MSQGWHSSQPMGQGPMGGGLRPPRPTWVSHTTASQGNRAMGDSYTISPSNHPQARRTQNLTPHGTCGLQAARPRPQGPLQIPAGTCRVTESAGSQWAQGSWGCGPLLRRRKQKSAQGNFIQLEMDLDRVPLLWSCPWLERSSKLQRSPSWLCHVTVYSSSRWFLQIS